MDATLRSYLDALYADGLRHDAAEPDRLRRRRNLEPDAAELLWLLLQAVAARTVVEVGTSNGFSTMWFADAVRRTGGRVVSVDLDPAAQREAAGHLARTGLHEVVDLRRGDGGEVLAGLAPAAADVVFLDSERPEYPGWWDAVRRALRPGGTLVVDNAISHAEEVAPFRRLVEAAPGWVGTLVDVGKGEFVAVSPAAAGTPATAP